MRAPIQPHREPHREETSAIAQTIVLIAFPQGTPWAALPHPIKIIPECDGNQSAVKRPSDHFAGSIH